MLFRTKTAMVSEAEALPGRTDQTMPVPADPLRQRPPPAGPVARRASRPPCSGWAASGAPRSCSGRRPASTRRPSATPAATRRTRRTRRCAPGAPATPRSCSSCSTPPSSPTSSCSRSSGRTTTRPRACARATTSARSTAASLYTADDEQAAIAERTKVAFGASLQDAGYGDITTEIAPLGDFFYAEPYHQQYLAKNPAGYCPHPRHRREVRLTATGPGPDRHARTTLATRTHRR